jgi:site-specific recombinase XerD
VIVLVSEAVLAFLDHRRAGGCAGGTIGLYGRQLAVWQAWLSNQGRPQIVGALTIDELRDFAAYLRTQYVPYASPRATRRPSTRPLSENTRASYHRTLRTFWTFLTTEEQLTPEQQRYFTRIDAPSVPDDPRPALDESTIKRLIRACGDGDSEESARNRACGSLLWVTGLRIRRWWTPGSAAPGCSGPRARSTAWYSGAPPEEPTWRAICC